MALLTIREFPDPILKTKAKPVTVFDDELRKLVSDMKETMYAAPGVGLAANQVGVALQILVLDASFSVEEGPGGLLIYKNQDPQVFINPKLLSKSGKSRQAEGCLSVPGITEEVDRSAQITISYQDESGAAHELQAQGFIATILQHEMDHLEGRVFLDRLSPIKRNMLVTKIKKGRLERRERSRLHVDL